jgi:hypothetical protein
MATVAGSCGGGGGAGTNRLNAFMQGLLNAKLSSSSVGTLAAFIDLARMRVGGSGAGEFSPITPLEPGSGSYDPRHSASTSIAAKTAAAGETDEPSSPMSGLRLGRSTMMPTTMPFEDEQAMQQQPQPRPPSPRRGASKRRHARSVSSDEEPHGRSSNQRRRCAPSDDGASDYGAIDDGASVNACCAPPGFDDAGVIDFLFLGGDGNEPSELNGPLASASGGGLAAADTIFAPLDLLDLGAGEEFFGRGMSAGAGENLDDGYPDGSMSAVCWPS